MRSLKQALKVFFALSAAVSLYVSCGGSHSSPPPPVTPAITTQPANQTVLEGSTATFTVVATGTAPLTYQWKKGGTAVTGATSASYTTPATVLADSGSSFTVTVTNAAGNVTSSAATLTVHSNPAIASFTPTPAIITAGGSASLAFSFTGGTGSIDNGVGAVVSGTNVNVTPLATTTYTLTVDNGFGTTKTATATVTVVPAPVAPVITLSAATVTASKTGLTAAVPAQAGMSYAWSITNGTITAGASTTGITYTAGAAGTPLTLTCLVSNSATTPATASSTANVTVVAAPVATSLTASSTNPLYGATVTLTPTFSGGTGVIDHGIAASATSGTAYPTAAITATTTYTLTVTNAANDTATATAVVTPQTVSVSAVTPANPILTVSTSQTFSSTVSGAFNSAITWSATGGTMNAATGAWTAPATAGSVTITATSAADATKSASTTVTVAPAPVTPVVAAPANVTTGKTGLTASVTAQTGMSYLWVLSSGTITGGQGTTAITFTAGAVGSTTVSCTVTNAAGASAPAGTLAVNVVAAPVATSLTASNANPLYGAAVTLTPVFSNGTGAIDHSIAASATSGTAYPTAAIAATTTYTLTVTNAANDTATATAVVTPQTVSVSAVTPANPILTVSTSQTFSSTVSGAFNSAITWSATGGAGNWVGSTWTAPTTAGNYTITATSAADATKSASTTVTVAPAPVTPVVAAPANVTTGKTGLTASVTAQPSMNYVWTLSSGSITAGQGTTAITFTAGAVGSTTVSCTVTNAAGASAPAGTAAINVVAAPVATSLTPSSANPLYGATVTLTPTFSGGTGVIDHGIAASATSGTAYPTATITATTTYTLTVTNAANDTATATAVVTPQFVSVMVLPMTTTITAGDTVTFTATVTGALNTSVTWSATGGSFSSNVWTAPGTVGTYTITATSVADVTKSNTATVFVVAAPNATITLSAPTVAAGATASASVPTQPTGVTYAWSLVNGSGTGSITSGTAGPSVTYTASTVGTFTLNVAVTNAAGKVANGSAVVTVVAQPYITTFSATPTNVVKPNSVTLSFTFGGGTGTISASDASITNVPVTSGGTLVVYPATTPSVIYTLTVTGGVGTTPATLTATVNVSTPLTFTTDLAPTGTAFVNTNYTFNVAVSGLPAANSFDWFFNGSKVATTTTPSYTINNVQTSNAGNWYVVATNSIATATSATMALTVSTGSTISGHVYLVNAGPTGVANVTVTLGGTSTATTLTDGSGYYHFDGLLNGSYTVTPSLVATGVSAGFLPASSSVSVSGSNMTADFQAAIGYTVSGTVNYGGSKTGRVYLVLNGNTGNVYGVSIPGLTGGYTIRGVPSGTYTLTAYMDTVGLGVRNAENPVGTLSGIGINAPLPGLTVNLVDPSAVTLGSAPAFNGIVPFNGGALVNYGPLTDGSGLETANAYELQWSTSSTFATVGSLVFKAQGSNNPMCFASGMTNTTYYFRIRGKAGTATVSPWSAVSSKVIGAATGFNTVSGTITLPVAATGPLAVALVNKAANQFFIVSIPKTSITTLTPAYSLTGVPNGTYEIYGILDQNSNGVIDPGDITNTNGNGLPVSVNGNLTGQNLTLSGANATANVTTSHSKQGTNDYYQLNFQVDGNVQLPVNVALQLGVNAFVDVGVSSKYSRYQFWMPWIRPTVGDAYPMTVAYSNATNETLTATVTGVVDAFAQNLTVNTATGTTTPTFNWVAPATTPAPPNPYTYEVGIWPQFSGGSLWWINGLSSSTTSILFNSDGSASGPLVTGTAYTWTVNVDDQYGNNAQMQVNYTP